MWRDAPCLGSDIDFAVVEPGTLDEAAAKAVCAGCDHRAPCADLGAAELHGVWGGVGADERNAIGRHYMTCAACGDWFWTSSARTEVCDPCQVDRRRDRNKRSEARRRARAKEIR